ncbi:hypothetical protein HYC85_015188 [Camellia sinensis]|uniref:Uncharacterized protein n=1 Tax=Camellia sinensis TaxID=4442 RepID=A0A7J7HAG9_CAMSI|nr:hypothetical protein HYC85_015188 [Camellia sinensis]
MKWESLMKEIEEEQQMKCWCVDPISSQQHHNTKVFLNNELELPTFLSMVHSRKQIFWPNIICRLPRKVSKWAEQKKH